MNSYNTLEEVRNYLLPLGFCEFNPPNTRGYESVTTMFQKRYDDEIGRKYFINAKIGDWSWTDKVPENFYIEYECQLYQKGTHNAFNLEFIDWNIEQIEKFIEDVLWDNLDYYEEF